jgi:hypothetical protein
MEQPIVSPDGAYIWDGQQWIPNPEFNFFDWNQVEVPEMVNLPQIGVSSPTISPEEPYDPLPTITLDSTLKTEQPTNVISSPLTENDVDQSEESDIDILKIGTITTIISHVAWIGIAIYILFQLKQTVYDQEHVQLLTKLSLGIYVFSALSTFFVKFHLEDNEGGNEGYIYLNSLCQKSLLIPFVVIGVIIVIALFILKFVLQFAIESSKQSSNTANSSRMKVCRNCGAVKQGNFARCCGRHLF